MKKSAPIQILGELFPKELTKAGHIKVEGLLVSWEKWEKGEFYKKIQNENWRKWTKGRFPARERDGKTTHPCYVVDRDDRVIILCPCTTKRQYERPAWFVPKGKTLRNAKSSLTDDVYVLLGLAHAGSDFGGLSGNYMGHWPKEWLVGIDDEDI